MRVAIARVSWLRSPFSPSEHDPRANLRMTTPEETRQSVVMVARGANRGGEESLHNPQPVPMAKEMSKLERRVVRAAEAALAERHFVTPIDVMVGVGWLTPHAVDRWRQGRVEYLERVVSANLHKLSTAMAVFRRWAEDQGLRPSETAYVARTRDRRVLRFSRGGGATIERAYRTHWISPGLSDAKRQRLVDKQSAAPELVVVSPHKDWTCVTCSGTGDLLIMEGPGPLCLGCADLDHLVFLAAGDAALTRRAKKNSALCAVVVRFSRARGRYERQGLLVEEDALERAERACLADEEARRRQRLRDEERRASHDAASRTAFAQAILRHFPGCPPARAEEIAGHAALRGSGCVGRTAAGRALDPEAVTLAVAAAVRHADTPYDELLMSGMTRLEARERVRADVELLVDGWRQPRAREPGAPPTGDLTAWTSAASRSRREDR